MGRKKRSHLPGGIFHITARTQGRVAWFTPPVRTLIVEYLAEALHRTSADLLAYAIMPNHFHLVLRQGPAPLSRLMQPLLRRTSHLVHRVHSLEGHVFERRYRDHACRDPEYVRNAIVYTHLNPVRAELVRDASEYSWSSHAAYVTEAADRSPRWLGVVDGLRLFSPGTESDLIAMRDTYAAYLLWRRQRDLAVAAEEFGRAIPAAPRSPQVAGGDDCWARLYAPLFCNGSSGKKREKADGECTMPDLAEIAARTIREIGGGIRLEQVRSAFKGRKVVRTRHMMIHRMSAAGYTGTAIARYLRISEQCVSGILRQQP